MRIKVYFFIIIILLSYYIFIPSSNNYKSHTENIKNSQEEKTKNIFTKINKKNNEYNTTKQSDNFRMTSNNKVNITKNSSKNKINDSITNHIKETNNYNNLSSTYIKKQTVVKVPQDDEYIKQKIAIINNINNTQSNKKSYTNKSQKKVTNIEKMENTSKPSIEKQNIYSDNIIRSKANEEYFPMPPSNMMRNY